MKRLLVTAVATALAIAFSTIAVATDSNDQPNPPPLKLTLDSSWSVYDNKKVTEFKNFSESENAKQAELIALIKRRVFEEKNDFEDPLLQ